MGAPFLAATTLASTGLQVAGGIEKAQGQAAGYQFAEAQAQRQSFAARTAANQTDSYLRDQLNTTLGNISAVRASAGVSDSPTEQAITARQTQVSDTQRQIRVGNLLDQADQSDADASYYNSAASSALDSGYLGAFGIGLKSLSGLGR